MGGPKIGRLFSPNFVRSRSHELFYDAAAGICEMASESRPILVVQIRENVIQAFDVGEPGFVEGGGGELLVEGDEAEDVVLDAFAGVIGTGACAEDERPVAGLGEEQFAAGLFQGAKLEAGGVGEFAGKLRHPLLRDLEVGLDPFVGLVEPDVPVTLGAPARRAGPGDLLGGMKLEILVR